MRFGVLGPLEVRQAAGTPVGIGGRGQRTLLARLLVAAGRPVSVPDLADALWGTSLPTDPRNAVQTAVTRLRRQLGRWDAVETLEPGYALRATGNQLDAHHFERLLGEASRRQRDALAAREGLDDALALWRGPAYAELAGEAIRAEATRLDERRLAAIETRAAIRLELGEAGELVGELEALFVEHPSRDEPVALLMRALVLSGRATDALAVHRAHREHVVEEFGIEPSARLADLQQAILRGELAPTPPTTFHASTSADPRVTVPATSAPPAPTTSLVGRGDELAALGGMLAQHRLVTVIGPGGVGKTRLVAEAARSQQDERGREAAWVELAPITDPAAVEHIVAARLGIDLTAGQDRHQALVGALAGRSVLLVLDNAEHVLDAVAGLVDHLYRACPQVQVLTTSRERLAIDGERVVALAPLATAPPAGEDAPCDAVVLFTDRAAVVTGDARPDAGDATIAAICRQLDGLPLAIELAAARVGAVPPEELLAGLEADAPGAVGQRRGATTRHRDLWSVVEWSHRMLDGPTRRLFARLSVFAGTFDVDAVHAICVDDQPRTATSDQLADLAERSLLTRDDGAAGRYRMLRPVRSFARQRLADRNEITMVADRHLDVLTARAQQAAGPPLTEAGRRQLEAMLDDLRAARRRAERSGDVVRLGRLIASLYRFDYWRTGAELLGWADDALRLDGMTRQPTAPQVHAAAGAAAWMRGDLGHARRVTDRGLELLGGRGDPAASVLYEAVADVAVFEGRLADAAAAFAEQVRLGRRGGDPDSETVGLAGLALTEAYAGRPTDAVSTADTAGEVAAAGPAARAFARYAQGECRAEHRPTQALPLLEEAIELARLGDAAFVEGVAKLTTASLRARHDDPEHAAAAFVDLLAHWRRSGNWTQQWTTLRNLVPLLVRLGRDEAATAIGAATAAAPSASPTFGTERDRLETSLATARTRLGHEASARAETRGRHLPPEDVLELALLATAAPAASVR